MGGRSKPQTSTIDQTQTQNSTQENAPWAPAVGALTGMVDSANLAYGATPKTATYTGPNQTQLDAAGMLRALAPSTSAGADQVRANASRLAGTDFLTGGFQMPRFDQINPAVDDLIAASLNPLRHQLDSNVLSIGDAAKLAGAYGGDRQDILKGTALGAFNDTAANVSAQTRYGAFNDSQNRQLQASQAQGQIYLQELAQQQQAASQFEQANKLAANPALVMQALGDQQAQQDIAAKQSAIDAPWAGLDRLSQVLSGVQGYGTQTINGTTTTKGTSTATPASSGGGAGGALSGALGGASAGAAFGPWGAGIGAVIGGLGGLFG